MRVLIYSESEAAQQKRDELRSEGHHASLRNPQYFDEGQLDKKAELVIADDEAVLKAYEGAGVATESLTVGEGPELTETGDGEPEGDDASLESLTVVQLKDLAAGKGVELKSGLNKAAIIEAIQQA